MFRHIPKSYSKNPKLKKVLIPNLLNYSRKKFNIFSFKDGDSIQNSEDGK